MKTKNINRGKIYLCGACGSWWGSQVGKARKTSLLLHLPKEVAAGLPWDNYRGWRERGQLDACPQCGTVSQQPIYAVT
ncbi:MAG: hypothetical protein ACK2UW_00945 [Anaerolineales bacterium]|jgi:rubrerythrin